MSYLINYELIVENHLHYWNLKFFFLELSQYLLYSRHVATATLDSSGIHPNLIRNNERMCVLCSIDKRALKREKCSRFVDILTYFTSTCSLNHFVKYLFGVLNKFWLLIFCKTKKYLIFTTIFTHIIKEKLKNYVIQII